MRFKKILTSVFSLLVAVVLLARAGVPPADETERVRAYTRLVEFNYISWITDAVLIRSTSAALGANRYLSSNAGRGLVLEYLDFIGRQESLSDQVTRIYADPTIQNPGPASEQLRQQQEKVTARIDEIGPLAESILQTQVASVVAGAGLTAGGQPVPPVWYHSTALPLALIVSPRTRIETTADISLNAGLNLDQIVTIEDQVSGNLDVSSLVVPVGGIGVYPTMVMRTTSLNWLVETVAHEWIHNFLTLRPLGINYETSPELRTMNETTASIAGKEIGQEVIRQYYPELAPPEPSAGRSVPPPPEDGGSQGFNFNQEMHAVRVKVDALLADGKVVEAERFMEASRKVFVENGYAIRKLNQAYFAFYGAYADVPGGAAGEDPVGPAVRALRQRSASLAIFLRTIARMTSFDQLKTAVGG